MEIKDLLEFHRSGKINAVTVAGEIERRCPAVSVVIDSEHLKSGESYGLMICPEYINGKYKSYLVIDDNALLNKLEGVDIDKLLQIVNMQVQPSLLMLDKFLANHFSIETSLLECVEIYLKIYKNLLSTLTVDILDTLDGSNSSSSNKLNDVLLSIESGNEKSDKIIEFISINNIIPSFSIEAAKKLFELLNGRSSDEYTDKNLEVNVNYNRMKELANDACIKGDFKDDPQKIIDIY